MGNWYGISIINPQQISVLDHVLIEYAYNGLTVKKSNPRISNSHIRFNYNAGILAEVKASPTVNSNVISENGYAGIICNLGAKPILSDNLITSNQIGLINFKLSQPNLGSLKSGDDYNKGQNKVFENRDYNIYNHSNLPIKAENNSWGFFNRRDVQATIFDVNDDSQFGTVDFEPFIRVRSNLENLVGTRGKPEPKQKPPQSESPADLTEETSLDKPVTPSNRDSSKRFAEMTQLASALRKADFGTSISLADIIKTNSQNYSQESGSKKQTAEGLVTSGPSNSKKQKNPQLNYNQIFLDVFLDEKYVILKKVSPHIAEDFRDISKKGIVQIRIVVDVNGRVESAQILRGLNPYLDKISIEAAQQFRFKPGKIKGRRVRFSTNIFFEF
jgi:TonB family protein